MVKIQIQIFTILMDKHFMFICVFTIELKKVILQFYIVLKDF